MISILIPTYNYNAFPLVSILHEQLENEKAAYEIICLDDGSVDFHIENQQINSLQNCVYEILEHNIGRSAIRNLLAKRARFDHLLFLDSDTIPAKGTFISDYLSQINSQEKAVYGGVRYQDQKPSEALILRWKYGRSRESLPASQRTKNQYLSFLTNCFLINKTVFEQVRFNENLKNWGHEDTLFSYTLKEKKIKIQHIENPVFHEGLDDANVFLSKTEDAVKGLLYLTENGLLDKKYVRLSEASAKLKKLGLQSVYAALFSAVKPLFLRQLKGRKPSLLLFDFYRLGLICKLNSK